MTAGCQQLIRLFPRPLTCMFQQYIINTLLVFPTFSSQSTEYTDNVNSLLKEAANTMLQATENMSKYKMRSALDLVSSLNHLISPFNYYCSENA